MRIIPSAATAGILLSLTSPLPAQIATGPEAGAKIPGLSLRDQAGVLRTFDDLKGAEGLLLLFHRSADW